MQGRKPAPLHFSAITIASDAGSCNSVASLPSSFATPQQCRTRNTDLRADRREPALPPPRTATACRFAASSNAVQDSAPLSWQLDETTMNPPSRCRFCSLLLLFGVLVCILFGAATFFFGDHSIGRLSAYCILTMGTCVLMCAAGLVLTPRETDQHFTSTENTPDAATHASAATNSEAIALSSAPQTHDRSVDKPDAECVAFTTN